MSILKISLFFLGALLGPHFAGANLPMMTFWKADASNKLVFITSAQTIQASLCSGGLTVQVQSSTGTPINAGSNLSITLAGPGSVSFYSDSSCTQAISSTTILSGTNSSTVYFLASTTGSKLLTAALLSYTTGTQTETISANPYIWTGMGSNANWSTAGNWAGGAAPGSGNIAVFDGTCASNCSPTIDAAISVAGVRMQSTYAGTITQGGNNITIGTNGWTQSAGTFTGSGSGSAVTLNGTMTLAGGTYTATTGTTTLAVGNWNVLGSPTFNSNLGTVSFAALGTGASSITVGTVAYNNVTFASGAGPTYNLSGTMTVNGSLVLAMSDYFGCNSAINNGTFHAYGSVATSSTCGAPGSATVIVKGNALGQTVTGVATAMLGSLQIDAGANPVTFSGTIRVQRNYVYTSSGTFTTTGSTLAFIGQNGGTLTPGTVGYNNVTFAHTFPGRNLGGSSMTINGLLSLEVPDYYGCTGVIDNGNLLAYGDVTISSNCGAPGSAVVILKGNASGQTVTGTSGNYLGGLQIDAGANPVTLSGTVQVRRNYTYTSSGTFTTTGSTLVFNTEPGSVRTITAGAVDYNNVTFSTAGYSGSGHSLGGGSIKIKGTLSLAMTDYYGCPSITNGTLQAYNNVTVSSNCGGPGSYALQFLGTSSPTLTVSGGSLGTGNVTVNLTAGQSLWLGSAASWNNTGQSLTLTSGGINLGGFGLTVKSLSLNSNTLTKNSGALIVNGVTAGTGSLYGGTVNP